MGERPRQPLGTSEQVLSEPEDRRLEVVGGVVAEKAAPTFEHAVAQVRVGGLIDLSFRGGGPQSGWWIASEVDLELGPEDLVRPDLAGWRRERLEQPPRVRPVKVVPDWICEILSGSNHRRDRVEKARLYHRAGVGHYWMLDPEELTLTVLKHEPDGYKIQLLATGDEPIRAEPFDALEFKLTELLER
jgi:Uma2 family endonuclease